MSPKPWTVLSTVSALALVVIGVGFGTVVPLAHAAGAAPVVPAGSPLTLSEGATSGGPATLVDPLDGTGIGPADPGNVSEYPGASVPLGMVQFSPDTSPDRQVTTGSGYDYADSHISGFSLTHLSGDGCAIYGDIPILPIIGGIPADPSGSVQPFSHASERASAGNYAVTVGQESGRIGVHLTATTRSALGSFTFPAHPAGNDDLLFKVSNSANGSTTSAVKVVGSDALAGSVTSGDFCGIPGSYTLYFSAQFSHPFVTSGTWLNSAVSGQRLCAGTASVACGAWLNFGHSAAGSQKVLVKVGLSFVSAVGAADNLKAEDPGWNLGKVSQAATAEWNGLLGRVAVSGGSLTNQRIFYTALYHSMLFPSVFSDDDGQYVGFDHRVHRLAKGQTQYSNISECDIYRTEVPLLATLLPGPTSQIVQSLLRDASETKGGYLPKWTIAANDAAEWDGDSADPIIADAYAFGARQFNLSTALKDMIHGATVPESGGFIVERENLKEYLAQGWVLQLTYDLTSFPYTDGGSETLEYSVDDFAIAQVARAAGDSGEAAIFAKRSQNWQNLFDPTTGYLAARTADGSFPAGPAFQPANVFDQLQGIAQQGWEEGNAIQYSWFVPQNLSGLFGLMGGDSVAVAKLNTFFSHLNATRFQPYDWAGNEPAMGAPYLYDYAGDPSGTQAVVRRIMQQLYPLSPVGEPGNDDLGALSSWYVWSALGLYPETPGSADLPVTSPLFSKVVLSEGNGHTLTIVGRHAPDTFIEKVDLATGSDRSRRWDKPWVPSALLREGGTLSVDLGQSPNRQWGTAASAAPPSFSQGAAPAVAFTAPSGALTMAANSSANFEMGVQEESAGPSDVVKWYVVPATGLLGVRVTTPSGTLVVSGGRAETMLHVTSGSPGTYPVTFNLAQGGTSLPNITLDVVVT